jgi:hypothetical protein
MPIVGKIIFLVEKEIFHDFRTMHRKLTDGSFPVHTKVNGVGLKHVP